MDSREFAEHAARAARFAREFHVLARADLRALEVCHLLGHYGPEHDAWSGHHFEGRLIFYNGRLRASGRCMTCGAGTCIDGS